MSVCRSVQSRPFAEPQAIRRRGILYLVSCSVFILNAQVYGGGQSFDDKSASDWKAFQKTVQPFFAKHCFACHGQKASGDVRLDQFADEAALEKGQGALEKALTMLRQRTMPPKKKTPPSDDELR